MGDAKLKLIAAEPIIEAAVKTVLVQADLHWA